MSCFQVATEAFAGMDWVERRASQEKMIASTLELTWAHLGIAIAHAVGSYNAHYGAEGRAFVRREYSDIIAVHREDRLSRTPVALVKITREARHIEAAYDLIQAATRVFDAVCDGDTVSIQHDGKTVDIERMSELALTPILFPPQPHQGKI